MAEDGFEWLADLDEDGFAPKIRTAGVAGAGGAGFPSYVKWESLSSCDHLLINHQESEPNFYADKWLGREHAGEIGGALRVLAETAFDTVVVGTKEKYRDEWMEGFEAASDATTYGPGDLPIDPEEESGVVVVYTPDVYTYSEENVLLMVTAGLQIGDDLPTDHGWIVHNTETLYNILRALRDGTPVTHKYVQVDGCGLRHRCLRVPIGTTAVDLLESAGVEPGELPDDRVLADGGPGWCYEITSPPESFGVRKRTNALLVLEEGTAREHTEEDGQIDVLDAYDWTAKEHEREPKTFDPETVRIPLITNAAYEGFVGVSEPVVEVDDTVTEGDVIAEPAADMISIPQHASIDGTVTEVTDTHVRLAARA